ncbi:serine hydrolase domain-containing protein [Brevibacillus formosus]|uniref:Penicillin-binding protein n=1 Tax=Brevibacillus formosus TaxID=54913 RepID=A0A837KTE5_9BACL|nr:serine hydrolase domain-containing protein [Brevibacillus formosus]KLI00202.1 penicillin-binding protein [Brevibacillus formosus]MED1959188.1 serine hydrolase [Brevibacillus formosus]PSJ97460.1 penicillin-binding protein [Brevibacillus formosus]GED56657.1 serine hydrolase [Brevibacillus formosus]
MNNQEWIVSYEEFVRETMLGSKVPGAAIGVAKHGQLVYAKGFGYRDVEQGQVVTVDTLFGIASITKSFTAIAIMQLQEAGKLTVADPVSRYLPEFHVKTGSKTEAITIHNFLTHSSGLPPLSCADEALKRGMNTYEELMTYMAQLDFPLLGVPGTEFSYSNDGYTLLGAIVERASGKPYSTYVKEHILQPAGMKHSCFSLVEWHGYEDRTPLFETPPFQSSGGLKSTLTDMMRYTELFRTKGLIGKERILRAESVQQMTTPYFRCEHNQYYGYGVAITPNFYGAVMLGHSGREKGIQACMSIIPENGLAAVVLTNLSGSPAAALAHGTFHCIENRPAKSTHVTYKEYDLPTDRLLEYAGEYGSMEGIHLQVSVDAGTLIVTVDHSDSFSLKAIDEDVFLANVDGSDQTVRFIRDGNQTVIRMMGSYRQIPKRV